MMKTLWLRDDDGGALPHLYTPHILSKVHEREIQLEEERKIAAEHFLLLLLIILLFWRSLRGFLLHGFSGEKIRVSRIFNILCILLFFQIKILDNLIRS